MSDVVCARVPVRVQPHAGVASVCGAVWQARRFGCRAYERLFSCAVPPHTARHTQVCTLDSLQSKVQAPEVREADEFGIKSVTLPVCLCLCGACPGSLPSLISRSIRESELGPGSGIRGPSAWVGGV